MKRNDAIYPYMNTADAYNKCEKKNEFRDKKICKNSEVFFKFNFFLTD